MLLKLHQSYCKLFIALYYRLLSAETKIKMIRLKPVLLALRSLNKSKKISRAGFNINSVLFLVKISLKENKQKCVLKDEACKYLSLVKVVVVVFMTELDNCCTSQETANNSSGEFKFTYESSI